MIKQYGLARQDLGFAIELNPDHTLTQNHLGILAEHVDRDLVAAGRWYAKAAEAQYPAAMTNLAAMLMHGQGGDTDKTRARSLLESAAARDYEMAYVPLGQLQREAGNIASARGWFERAVEAGVAGGHYELGLLAQRSGDGDAATGQGHVGASNRLAWLLVTCPTETVCDGQRALGLAQYGVDAESSPGRLDTLAAAFARVGEYAQAEGTVKRVQQLLELGSGRYARYSDRLRLYSSEQPYRLWD